MISWLIHHPVIVGIITFFLMWIDWLLTIVQERERKEYYYQHYQSYPVNTIEGNPALQKGVLKRQIVNPKHFIAAIVIGAITGFALTQIPGYLGDVFLGYVWGIFLIVLNQHLSNLLGYRAGRRGVHGKLWMHQRTGLRTQSGRYLSITVFLFLLSVLSGSYFIYGVTLAGFTSAIRQWIWLRKVPQIAKDDLPPDV